MGLNSDGFFCCTRDEYDNTEQRFSNCWVK